MEPSNPNLFLFILNSIKVVNEESFYPVLPDMTFSASDMMDRNDEFQDDRIDESSSLLALPQRTLGHASRLQWIKSEVMQPTIMTSPPMTAIVQPASRTTIGTPTLATSAANEEGLVNDLIAENSRLLAEIENLRRTATVSGKCVFFFRSGS